jgi:DNA-binding YbaB/EbfC family protein
VSNDGIDPSQLFAQARELQDKVQRVQEELRRRTVEATVGGGMVTAEVNGGMELVAIRIDPQAVDPRDVEMLQDLIVAAVGQAMRRAGELAQQEMQRVTGVPIGNLFGGPGGSR